MNIKLKHKIIKLASNNNKTYNKQVKAIITGILTENKTEYLVLDAALKSDCLLNTEEFKSKNLQIPEIGTEINVNIINFNNVLNRYYVSLIKTPKTKKIKNIKKLFYSKGVIQVKVIEIYNSFYKLEAMYDNDLIIGTASKGTNDLNVNDIIFARIIKLPSNNTEEVGFEIIISKNINIGDIVTCSVKNIKDFSVFVSIDDTNLYGVIHNSDLLEEKLENGSLIKRANYKIDEKIQAKVIKIIKNKIILSIKQIQQEIVELNIGGVYKGQVIDIKPFGFIIHMPNGQSGLLHNKEVVWNNEKKKLEIGDVVNCSVIEINKEKNSIYLTAKKILNEDAIKFIASIKKGDIIEGTLLNKKDNYVFIKLGNIVDGILHISEINWDLSKAKEQLAELKSGNTIKVKVFEINPEGSRILLSLKRLISSPDNKDNYSRYKKISLFDGLKLNEYYDCTIKSINYSGASVSIPNIKIDGFIKKIDFGGRHLTIGEVIKAELTSIDYKRNSIYLSIASIEVSQGRKILSDFNKAKTNDLNKSTFGDLLDIFNQ
jgi:small subunit ribosomal protein S1